MRDLLASDDPARRLRHRPLRPPLRAARRRARRRPRRPRRLRLHRRHRRERRPRSAPASPSAWPGSAPSSTRRPTRPAPRASPPPASRVALLVVPTDEELMIARHTSPLRPPLITETPHDPSRRQGEAARRPEGPDRRHRQRPLDRLGLRPRLPRLRRRARDHLPQRKGEAARRAAGARGRGADLHADGRDGRRPARGGLRADRGGLGRARLPRPLDRLLDQGRPRRPRRRRAARRASRSRWTSRSGPSCAWPTSPSR